MGKHALALSRTGPTLREISLHRRVRARSIFDLHRPADLPTLKRPMEEEAEPILVPGYRLDRYELVTPIASGGMASVWLARLRGKRGFEKLFAIKTIKTELTDDARFKPKSDYPKLQV